MQCDLRHVYQRKQIDIPQKHNAIAVRDYPKQCILCCQYSYRCTDGQRQMVDRLQDHPNCKSNKPHAENLQQKIAQ